MNDILFATFLIAGLAFFVVALLGGLGLLDVG